MNTIRENKNLNLDSYKPYIHDFHLYSIDLFDFGDEKLFNKKMKEVYEIPDEMKWTQESVFQNILKHL